MKKKFSNILNILMSSGPAVWYSEKSLVMKVFIAALLPAILFSLYLMTGKGGDINSSKAVGTVTKGDFTISTTESGAIKAKRSMTVSAPKVGINLQIIYLVDEGTFVKKGDSIVQFDPGEIQKSIDQKQSELDIAKADLERADASSASQIAKMEAGLKDVEANLRLQELSMEKLKYEAQIDVETGKLRLEQARIKVAEARENMESQLKILKIDREKQVLRIRQAEAELDKWKDNLDKLTLTAPADGLVVYQESWNRAAGGMVKIKVGDTSYAGEALVELPDLSELQVKVQINEVDISNISVGHKAKIVMDAFDSPQYTGVVTEISTLARKKGWRSSVKVFDVIVDIDKVDDKLKPGMTAKVEIISEVIPDVISVPIESIFDVNGEKVVYVVKGKSWKARTVTVGKRNDNFAIITDGVKEGEKILLNDPQMQTSDGHKEKKGSSFKF